MLTKRIIQGIIVSRSAGKLHVVPSDRCEKQSSCESGCTSCGGKSATEKYTIALPDADRYPVGSNITVATWIINEALGALIVFGIPLFFATGALAIRYFTAPATIESAPSLIGAACAFAAGGVVVALIDRGFRRRYPPSVISATLPARTSSDGNSHG